jgi:hypothetical protein
MSQEIWRKGGKIKLKKKKEEKRSKGKTSVVIYETCDF